MHHSADGGATWLQSSLPGFAGDARQGDPTIDWTSDGTAWSVTIGISPTLALVLRAYKSSDGGGTWTFDSTITGTQTAMDKQAFWVDHNSSSPFKDNMYLIWHNGGPCFVSVRPGPGGAWSAPQQISGGETTGTAIGGDIKTNSHGDVFAFWPDTGSQHLFVAKSTDGGSTFGAPVTIANTIGAFNIGVPAQDGRRVLIYLSGAHIAPPLRISSMPFGPILPAALVAAPPAASRAAMWRPSARAASGSLAPPTAALLGMRPFNLMVRVR